MTYVFTILPAPVFSYQWGYCFARRYVALGLSLK